MLRSFYSGRSPRCGRKGALVALGHRLLRIIYTVLFKECSEGRQLGRAPCDVIVQV